METHAPLPLPHRFASRPGAPCQAKTLSSLNRPHARACAALPALSWNPMTSRAKTQG